MTRTIQLQAILMAGVLAVLLQVSPATARVLLTQEEALKQMFGETDRIVTRTCVMSDKELENLKKVLGGKLIHFQEGAAQNLVELNTYTFYLGLRAGRQVGVALIEVQPGKWGPVKTIIAMDPDSGKVKDLAVMELTEIRGRPIALRGFLDQFIGKGRSDPLRLQSDIRAVTGATVSADAACFAVRKAVIIYDEVFRK
jgi:hypothetical protein